MKNHIIGGVAALAVLLSAPDTAQAQSTVFFACYVPNTGLLYRVNPPDEPGQNADLKDDCTVTRHVKFQWTDAVGADHGALIGLADDDHPEYVREDEAAGGDLGGTYPNPTVDGLQGNAVAMTAPGPGQVLTWSGTSWVPAPPSGGGGGVSIHGLLSGLTADDHLQYILADGVRSTTNGFAVTGTFGTGSIPASGGGVRIMWYPRKAAFRVGQAGTQWDDNNIGDHSVAMGLNTTASGDQSTAMGEHTTASGRESTALGKATTASGNNSTAMGLNTTASGDGSTAMGGVTTASGTNSTAMGNTTTASGSGSMAMGTRTEATAIFSTAMGSRTTASGPESTAMGNSTTASGGSSTAMGGSTEASGSFSTAMGLNTTASGDQSTAMGNGTRAIGTNSTAMGSRTTASGNNSTAMGLNTTASGAFATVMGLSTTASGDRSTAMGNTTTASGLRSTAMGGNTTASANNSTAMGDQTTASGSASTAMGFNTTASGFRSTAMGSETTASEVTSTAMGEQTTASGRASTAMGVSTTASGFASTAMGRNASTNLLSGSFVYGDASSASIVNAPAPNSFTVRAAGGTTFFSSSALSSGVSLASGAGAWASVSDRNRKENFRDEDGEAVLTKIAALPIQRWSYKSQASSIRHLGPTAQDFYAAFGLGEGELTITTTDIDGVNLLAVQALEKRTAELRAEVAELEEQNARLLDRLMELEAMVRSMVGAELN